MRLAVTSDLHVDHNGAQALEALVRHVRALAPDALVVAGDLAASPVTLLEALLALRSAAPEVLFVAGNHDVWSSPGAVHAGVDAWARLDGMLPALCDDAGVRFLDGGPVVLGPVGFAGSLGWYDLTFRDPELDAPIEAYRRGEWAGVRWNDHRMAVWRSEGSVLPMEEVAARLRTRLRKHLDALASDRVVVVTHVLPFQAQLTPGALPGWRFAQAFMGSTALGELILADGRVELAVAGHAHTPSDLRVGGVRALVSPLGYAHEWRGAPVDVAVARAVRVVDL